MASYIPSRFALFVFGFLLLTPIGCSSEQTAVSLLRKDLILNQEPAETTSIAAATEAVESNDLVTIVADVVSDESKAFVKGQAAFLVTEVGENSTCSDVDCPFCDKCKGKKASNATVQFVDQSGNPLPIDTRDLLGISAGDTIVIKGKGEMLEGLNMLQVTAENIFVRQKANSAPE